MPTPSKSVNKNNFVQNLEPKQNRTVTVVAKKIPQNIENKTPQKPGEGLLLKRKLKTRDKSETSEAQENNIKDDDFTKAPWIVMLQNLNLFGLYKGENNIKKLKFNIEYATTKGYRDKIPLLVVLVKKFSASESDASVIIKDPTGEMEGTVHKQVLELFPDISSGSVLVLRKVAIFSPTLYSHYLNITSSNIVCVFPNTVQIEDELVFKVNI